MFITIPLKYDGQCSRCQAAQPVAVQSKDDYEIAFLENNSLITFIFDGIAQIEFALALSLGAGSGGAPLL